MLRFYVKAFSVVLAVFVAFSAFASDRGPVTNLPIPRFVSLKASEGNARRGPSLAHRIDWVFTHRHMPLIVVGEYGHWRRIEDRDGAGGWMHYSLLSGMRTVIVTEDSLPLLAKAEPDSSAKAVLERDVIARLEKCAGDWCRITADGHRGWAPRAALWGVSERDARE